LAKNTRFGKVAAVTAAEALCALLHFFCRIRSNLTAPPSRFGGAAVRSWGAPVLEQVSVAHVFPRGEDVDGRDKHGYDGERGSTPAEWDRNLAVTSDNASPARRIAHE
jgi:hypothetical protein